MKRISIIGAGFAGLSAIREIRKRDAGVHITLIAPRAELHYLPGIIWIPSGLRQRERSDRAAGQLHAAHEGGIPRGAKSRACAKAAAWSKQRRARRQRWPDRSPPAGVSSRSCRASSTPSRRARASRRPSRSATACSAMQGGTIAVGFAGNPNEPSAMRGGPMFEFLFGIDQQLRREGRRDRFELVFFNPRPSPATAWARKPWGACWARWRGAASHPSGPQTPALRGRQGRHRRRRIQGRPDPVHARHDRQRVVRPHRPAALARRPAKADAHCRVDGRDRVYVAGDSGSFPGPDWMPKQAHMADLQAAAAAANLLAELRGEPATATFKVELVCIVDANDRGMLVVRTEQRNFVLPNARAFHWMKRGFERCTCGGIAELRQLTWTGRPAAPPGSTRPAKDASTCRTRGQNISPPRARRMMS